LKKVENQKVKGIVVIRVIDKKTGKVIREIKKENVITNGGLGLIASRYNAATGYWCLVDTMPLRVIGVLNLELEVGLQIKQIQTYGVPLWKREKWELEV